MHLKRIFSSCIAFSLTVSGIEGKEPASSFTESIEASLKNPSFSDGTLRTDLGGVITAEGLRIQAMSLSYTNTSVDGKKVIKVAARGDLLFEYRGQFLTGEKLEYDFVNRTGYLSHARSGYGIWFVGGDSFRVEENGSVFVENGFVTTSENQKNTWEIRAAEIKLTEDKQLSASNIQLKLGEVPVLWLPAFKSDLGFVSDPPIRYKFLWDKGVGPRVSVRYRVFSIKEFSLFGRLDYRISKGPGAAIESEYFRADGRCDLVTRTYGAYDKVVYDEKGLKRYRLQGLFRHESSDEKTHTRLTYDKFHDLKMINDFPSSDFEIDTQKRTRLLINHQENVAFGTLDFSPRLNTFESINQKLPLVKAGIRPFRIGKTGIMMENFISAGYLDYVYAHDLLKKHPTLHETHSGRTETRNRLYGTFSLGPLHLTPAVGVTGLFYNNNPQRESVGQGVVTYGVDAASPFYRKYAKARHTVDPYLRYFGISHPKAHLQNHYTFTIEDGLYQINSLRLGVRNFLQFTDNDLFSPNFCLDLYTYGFFNDKTFTQTFPKQYLSFSMEQPSYNLEATGCWNTQESVLDFANLLSKVTINENAAFILEFRHRSRFDWRKADHENFLVDMARSIPDLVNSPLSDGRNTILGKLQVRLSPKWNCGFSSHYGFGRKNEPSYHSFKIDGTTLLSSKWLLKFSYTHTTNDDRFSMQVQLAK